MSYADGWAALNLEMPDRVPRTEYSVEGHWEVLQKVTGMNVDANSDQATIEQARRIFCDAWNYGFKWNVTTNHEIFGKFYTDMGHASYDAGGSDFREIGESQFQDEDDVLNFDPWEAMGKREESKLVAEYNADYQEKIRQCSDVVNMPGIYVSCMSGLIDLFGWDLLLTAAGVDPEGFGEVTNRYASWIGQYFEALAKSESPVVMIHDDIVWTQGAFMHPDWYRKYLFPNYHKLFRPLIEAGKKIIYTSDGTYTEFVDDIAACGIHGFVMEPTTDMAYIAEKYGKTHAFVGNADTRILLKGTKEDIYQEVKRCMDIGKACPGFFMAVGNHIPANTPVDNVLYYNECFMKLGKR